MNRRFPFHWGRNILTPLVSAALLVGVTTGTANAQTKTVNLRVLLVSGGNQETQGSNPCVSYADPGLELMKQLLDEMMVPYDVYDAAADNLHPQGHRHQFLLR